jgi:hypothetical protein
MLGMENIKLKKKKKKKKNLVHDAKHVSCIS